MIRDRDFLDKVQIYSNIVAAIVIPAILAYFGLLKQSETIESEKSKEFVAMAINILSDESEEPESELKQWAVEIINTESPVKLTQSLESDLSMGKINLNQYFKTPEVLLIPPEEVPSFEVETNGDLLEYIIELQYFFERNKIHHESLIKIIREREQGYAELIGE